MALRSSFRLGLTALSFWPFLPIAARAPIYGRLILELVADPRVPWSRKAILGIAAAYVISPIDLIPDLIPFVSRVDDVMVTIIALDLFFEGVPSKVMIEKMYTLGIDGRELERDMEAARRFLPLPFRSAARRLPALIEASADVIREELQARGIIETKETDKEAIET
ncbi:MAG: YkvA family protein [Chloroflexota bacterium]